MTAASSAGGGALRRWRRLYEVEGLGERAAVLEGPLPLAVLTRLCASLVAPGGAWDRWLEARAAFSREGPWTLAVLEADAAVALRCGRCLEVYDHRLVLAARVALVADEAAEGVVPAGLETLVCARPVRPLDLLEDELIMAAPLVPAHPDPADCGEIAERLRALAPAETG